MFFLDALTGYVVGGPNSGASSIQKTTDGGATWSSQTSNTTGMLQSVYFVNKDSGFACVPVLTNNIIRTTDGGTTWTFVNTGISFSPYDVYFRNKSIGFISGTFGTILKTTDCGAT